MCPYYKNKQVFDEFNEIIEAFGGKPMTEDEFKSRDLRNQRSGQDLVAMEVAYMLWDKNNGYALDKTPEGKDSKLFEDLLEIAGDRKSAMILKSNVYSDNFINWFGDWIEDRKNSSKVVDDNGEPLIVRHYTNNENLEEFSTEFDNYFSQTGGTKNAIFFTLDNVVPGSEDNFLTSRKSKLSCYLNIRELDSHNGTKEDLHKAGTSYREVVNKSAERNSKTSGIVFTGFDDNKKENQTIFVIHDANQVKSVTNEGSFSKESNKINAQKTPHIQFDSLQKVNPNDVFGDDLSSALESGQTVSSMDIVNSMLNNDLFGTNTDLAKILGKHDVPVMYGETELDILAVTVTENNGGSYIVINKNALTNVSTWYAAQTILHEIIHAITVDAINNPKTQAQKELAKVSEKAFTTLNKIFDSHTYSRANFDQGFYALSNQKEFAAIFMSDEDVRNAFYEEAKKFDEKIFNRVKNAIKKLVNAFTNMLLEQKFFKESSTEVLQNYENVLREYVYNQTPIVKGNLSKKTLKTIYAQIDEDAANAERDDLIARALRVEIANNDINAQHEQAKNLVSFEDITKKLATRLLSVKNSTLEANVKSQELQSTKTAIELLNSANVSKLVAIQNILVTAGSYIHGRQREISNINSMTAKDIRFALHSDFALYEQIFEDFGKVFKNAASASDLISEYNKLRPEGTPEMTEEKLKDIASSIDNIKQTCEDCRIWMERYRRISVVDALSEIGDAVQSPTIHSYIDEMFVKGGQRPVDMMAMEHLFGAADAVKDESIRLISHVVKKAKDIANDKTIDKAVEILEAQKKLKSKREIAKLYETDEKGRRTGYLIRKRNYGRFYKDYDDFLVKLNRTIAKKYDIALEDDNRIAPDHKEARVAWQKGKNEWLSLHCDREYTKEYYDAWSEISHETRMAMRDINNLIYTITNKVVDPVTKEPNYENLSDEDWERLQSLFEQKRLLRSFYDLNGKKKEVGTPEYNIAKELNTLYEKLYKGQTLKKNEAGWAKARNQIIEKCGGVAEYEKWMKGEESNFDEKTFQKWEDRNTRWEFKKNDEDQAIIFAQIEEEMQGRKPYYGEEYEAIKKQINDMLSPFYKQNGEINSEAISETLKNEIKKLLKRQNEIRKKAVTENPNLKQLSEQYGAVFNKYLEFVDTQQFRKIKSELRSKFAEIPELYSMVISSYGTNHFNFQLQMYDSFRPYKWYQRMQAKDKLTYMEPKPGDGWIDKTNNVLYKNDKYDETENTVYVPKMNIENQDANGFLAKELGIVLENKDSGKYDNSKKYEYVTKQGTAIADYYNIIKKTIEESNALQTNRPVVDNFLLPQVIGSLWQQTRKRPWFKNDGKFAVIWRYLKEKFGKESEEDQDTYGIHQDLSETDEAGGNVDYKYDPFKDTYVSSMPDGSAYRSLPQFYTKKLKDPSRLSSDLSGIVIGYYNMSQQYHEKSKIADQCELIVEELKNAEFGQNNAVKKIESLIGGRQGESNTYQMARDWLDANLYDVKKIQQQHGGVNWTKFASTFSMWTTATNLGLNPKVAIVGALTTGWTHVINALTGQKYDVNIANKAGFATIYHIGKNLFGARLINDSLTDDKQMLMMEMCNVSNQLSKKYQNTQRSRIAEALNRNWIFGMLSTCDYIMKAQITTSVFMSYRYVDGKFVTKDDILMSQYKGGNNRKSYVKQKLNEWENGACLYDVISSKDHKLVCDERYKQAFEDIKHIVINRAQKYSEHADGMATEEQKAMITRGIIGSAILIHRQYLPLMVQERFGHSVYDYDTQQMKNGQFRRLMKFVSALLMSNRYAATASGVGMAAALSAGPLGMVISGGLMYYMSANKQKKGGETSMKDVINKTFNDFSTREANMESQMNRYAFKQIGYELALFHLLVNTAASMICFYADDHKKNKIANMLAYWMRGFQWESYTPYRFNDIFQNFKSPSAALSMIDRISTFFNMANESLVEDSMMWLLNLCGLPFYDKDYDSQIKRGTYKGHSRAFRDFMKMTPGKNIYEQYVDSRAKRTYAENQLYMIDKKEEKKSLNYKIYKEFSK